MDEVREIRHFHLFAGLGGGAKGFNRGEARVGNLRARFRCLGGVDVDAAAMRDFQALAGVPGTVLDLFDRRQYIDFHGVAPPPGWREAVPADIRVAAGNERPHIVFLSPPCKGFSGLLAEQRSRSTKYQALNRLTLRGVWLMLEAFGDDPPDLIVFENVPRIANRGRHLLDQIADLLRGYGYAVAETNHDCGEIGGLAQSRKRFLLVARTSRKCRRSSTNRNASDSPPLARYLAGCLCRAIRRAALCTASRDCPGKPGCALRSLRPARTGAASTHSRWRTACCATIWSFLNATVAPSEYRTEHL